MTLQDPRPKLKTILFLCDDGHLPAKAGYWATPALEKCEGIYSTMDDMERNGVDDVPTSGQEKALKNYYRAACRWLGIDPEEEDEDEEW